MQGGGEIEYIKDEAVSDFEIWCPGKVLMHAMCGWEIKGSIDVVLVGCVHWEWIKWRPGILEAFKGSLKYQFCTGNSVKFTNDATLKADIWALNLLMMQH